VSRLVAALVLLALAAPVRAEAGPFERYFGGLRQRGLFDLAEGEALRRLATPRLAVEEKAPLVGELARTFAEHAKYVEGREQADLWDRADNVVAEFLAANPKAPAAASLDLLRGELALSRGETLRWLAELRTDQPGFRAQAEAALASAVERLTASERALSRRLLDRSRDRTTERTEPLTPPELSDLVTRARLSLGTAELERARLADGPAKAEHLAAAERWLEVVAKGPAGDGPTWRAQVALAEAARLAGKADLARRRLAAPDPASLPDAAKDEIAAVMAKLLLDEDKPDRAAAFLIDYRRKRGALTGELRLAQVRALAAAAAALDEIDKKSEAKALRDEIPTVVRWAEAEQGGYWAYRVRLAARDAERSGLYGYEVAEQVRKAEAAVAAGRTNDAAAAYAEAERLASADPAAAAPFAFTRASLLLRADRFEEAAAAFASIADTYPAFDKAAEAHLLAAYALGRLHDADPSTARREAYAAKLEEHRAKFPGGPTAAEATLRRAKLYEARRQYSKALPLLKEIAADPQHGPAAQAAIARDYESLLRYLETARKSASTPDEAAARAGQIDEWTAAAVRDLTALTEPLRSPDAPREPLSAQQAELALRSVRLLESDPASRRAADALLDRLAVSFAAEHPVAEKEFWDAARRSALPLRVVSLAARDRTTQAADLIGSLAEAPIGDLVAVVRGLAELHDPDGKTSAPVVFGATEGPAGPRLSDLRETAVDLLARRRAELSPDEARRLDLVLAEANLAGGHTGAAADRYEAALAERPNDRALLAQAAAALLDSGDPAAVKRARDYWRRLEKLETAGGESWLKARLKVIESDLALGDTAAAKKLLTVTRLLYPKLGGGDIKAGYDAAQHQLDMTTK
jgi:hypothetical protein